MKRRSFFRSLAAALISVPLARMIGAEIPRVNTKQFQAKVDSFSDCWIHDQNGKRNISREEFDQWVRDHPDADWISLDDLFRDMHKRISNPSIG